MCNRISGEAVASIGGYGCSVSPAESPLPTGMESVAGSWVITVAANAPFGSFQLHHHHADVLVFCEHVRVNEERLHGEGAVSETSVQKYLAVSSPCLMGPSRRHPGVFLLTWCLEQAETPGGHPFYLDLA